MSKYGNWTRGEDEALLNILGGEDVARAILRGDLKAEIKQFELLTRVAVVQVEKMERFVASERKEAANIGYMWPDFQAHFADMVEENVPVATIVGSRLEKNSRDAPILAKLGSKAKIKLAHFYTLLQKQAHGEDGILLTNGYANVAYIEDGKGVLWAVRASWHSRCRYWGVHAYSVEDPGPWRGGRQVLSCDSDS
jgi:hypothetical protein